MIKDKTWVISENEILLNAQAVGEQISILCNRGRGWHLIGATFMQRELSLFFRSKQEYETNETYLLVPFTNAYRDEMRSEVIQRFYNGYELIIGFEIDGCQSFGLFRSLLK